MPSVPAILPCRGKCSCFATLSKPGVLSTGERRNRLSSKLLSKDMRSAPSGGLRCSEATRRPAVCGSVTVEKSKESQKESRMAQPHRKTSRVDGRPAGRRGISAMLRLASRGLKHHRTPRAGELGKAIRTTSVANRRKKEATRRQDRLAATIQDFIFWSCVELAQNLAGVPALWLRTSRSLARDGGIRTVALFFPTTVWWGSSRSGPVQARLVRCHAAVGCEEDCCRVIFG